MSDVASALQNLASYRTRNSRESQDTFDNGIVVLKNDAAVGMGDDSWSFFEQLALAAIDVGRIDVTDRCLELLSEKFPNSPRVDCLTGIRMEATEPPETALKFYDQLLEIDSANAAIWKRRISVLRRMGKIDKAVGELSKFLDTFYTDVEGWLELADIYASCHQYTYALQSLSHVLLLNPQNPFYVLQAAETAYIAEDVPLAIKYFLIVIDMTDDEGAQAIPEGITTRAWYGVQLCAERLISDPRLSSSSASHTPVSNNIKLVKELAEERLKTAYSRSANGGDEVLS